MLSSRVSICILNLPISPSVVPPLVVSVYKEVIVPLSSTLYIVTFASARFPNFAVPCVVDVVLFLFEELSPLPQPISITAKRVPNNIFFHNETIF